MKIPTWLTLQAVTLAIAGACAFGWVGSCNATKAAKDALAKQGEAAALDKAGLQRAHEATEKELRESRSQALDELGKALAALHIKSKPVAVVSGTTGPVTAGDATPGTSPGPAARDPGAGDPLPPASGPASCLLAPGDKGEIRVSGAAVRTEAGNTVVAGRADAYALDPERHLFGGPLRLDVKVSSPQDSDRGPGWGAGAALVLGPHGYEVGPAIAAPPLRWWKLQFDASAGVTLGPQGAWSTTATVIGRIR